MNYHLYSLFDRCTSMYGDIIICVNDEDAKRKIAYTLQNNPYKADLVVYKLGSYDCELGKITPFNSPVMLCNVAECYEVSE